MGVPPLCEAGLLRGASSHLLLAGVSPLKGGHLRAGSPPPSALDGAQGVAGLRPSGLAGSLANAAIKAAPSSR